MTKGQEAKATESSEPLLPVEAGLNGQFPQMAAASNETAKQQGDEPPLTRDQIRDRDKYYGPNIEGIHTIGFNRSRC